MGRALQPQQGQLTLPARITHENPQQEAIELGFGKAINAFLLYRILRCQHHEGAWQRQRGSLNGNLNLLHRFQQGRLGLGRRPVHFIGQQNLAENRTAPQHEIVLFAIKDIGSRHIGGQQIRRELNAVIFRTQDAGKGLG